MQFYVAADMMNFIHISNGAMDDMAGWYLLNGNGQQWKIYTSVLLTGE